MRLNRLQILAAATALKEAEGEVSDLRVDGVSITDFSSLAGRAEAIENHAPGKAAKLIDEKAAWIAKKITKPPKSKVMQKVAVLKERLLDTKLGAKIDAFVKRDPERAMATKPVEIHFADGRVETREIQVVDLGRTAMLQRFSIAFEAAAFIPFIPFWGVILPTAAALSSLIGAGVALVSGDRDMAHTWAQIAKKHAVLGATKTGALALIEDLNDLDELTP